MAFSTENWERRVILVYIFHCIVTDFFDTADDDTKCSAFTHSHNYPLG